MTDFTFSAPSNGSIPGFNFTVTGTLQSVTQSDGAGNPETINGYVLTSASGTFNGESVSLYTSGFQTLNDVYSGLPGIFVPYNNIVKESPTGDFGLPTEYGVDVYGFFLQSSAGWFYTFRFDGANFVSVK